jgi:hypothetical protein
VLAGNTTGWVFVTGAYLSGETAPVGEFHAYIDSLGGPTDFATPPNTDWILDFTVGPYPAIGTGIGEYVIDPEAAPGSEDTGTNQITYDLYPDDPLTRTACSSSSESKRVRNAGTRLAQ